MLGVTLPRDPSGASLIKGVLRNTLYGMLFNVSVIPTDSQGYARPAHHSLPDDATYSRYDLYARIPRVFVIGIEEDGSYRVLAEGFTKFEAFTRNDDDDDDNESAGVETIISAPTKLLPGAVEYYADEKANGHTVMYRLLPGTRLLLAGTKNCAHLALLTDVIKDIAAVKGSAPTEMVADAYECMSALLQGRHAEEVLKVLETGVLLIGERETNQHIRYYEDPGVMFFDHALPSAFRTPETLGPFSPEELTPEKILHLRSGGNAEGWVLRGIDASGVLVGRLKLKTLFYVLARMAREAYNPLDGLSKTLVKWRLRMHQRNSFLQVDGRYLDTVVFDGFFAPLAEFMYAQSIQRDAISFRGPGFASVLHSFCTKTGISCDFRPIAPAKDNDAYTSNAVAALRRQHAAGSSCGGNRGGILIATACMPPGIGKTSFMVAAARNVLGIAADVTEMAQDDFASPKEFYGKLKAHLRIGNTVFLHRCCFNPRDRTGILAIVRETGSSVLFLQPVGLDSDSTNLLLLYTALRGVLTRGSNHVKLGALSDATKCLIAGSFWVSSQACSDGEFGGIQTAAVRSVDILLPEADVGLPDAIIVLLRRFIAVLKQRKPFDTKCALETEAALDLEVLMESVRHGAEARHPISFITNAVVEECLQFTAAAASATATQFPSVAPSGYPGVLTARSAVLYACLAIGKKDSLRLYAEAGRLGVTSDGRHTLAAEHVTLVYRPTAAQVLSMEPHVGKHFVVTAVSLLVSPEADIAAFGVVISTSDDDVRLHVPVDAHITLFYDQKKHRAKDSKELFHVSAHVRAIPCDLECNAVFSFRYL